MVSVVEVLVIIVVRVSCYFVVESFARCSWAGGGVRVLDRWRGSALACSNLCVGRRVLSGRRVCII